MSIALQNPAQNTSKIRDLITNYAPKATVVLVVGYYSLGIAYSIGLMAVIDKIAIGIILHYAGYAGVGKLMPSFQQYSSWGVRGAAMLAAGFVFDLAIKVGKQIYNSPDEPKAPVENPANKA